MFKNKPDTPYQFTKSTINPDALKQSTYWYDKTGKQYIIKNMSKWHARGALGKLWGAFGPDCLSTPLARALDKQARSN